MLRPLRWWALALAGFAFGYLDRHFDRAAELGRGYAGGAGGWLWASMVQPLVERFPQFAQVLPLPAAVASPACLVGSGEPWTAALGLSIRKALPFAGVGSTEKLNQIYACLYGIHGEAASRGDLPARFTPVIPDGVDYLGIAQLLLSLLLLFLFLLAVRSHFRIR
ncbi:MAG: hypothetical protein HWD60_19765 [Defluviicoccus sp.]|nr:MAG: hypothetical protein HWD60_19765 [Defluviicoccus sp.]